MLRPPGLISRCSRLAGAYTRPDVGVTVTLKRSRATPKFLQLSALTTVEQRSSRRPSRSALVGQRKAQAVELEKWTSVSPWR